MGCLVVDCSKTCCTTPICPKGVNQLKKPGECCFKCEGRHVTNK